LVTSFFKSIYKINKLQTAKDTAPKKDLLIEFGGESLCLSANKVLFLPKHKILCLADLHLGKAAHFRKHGSALPSSAINKDLKLLKDLIELYKPEQVIFLGDLFHSKANESVAEFKDFLAEYLAFEFILIKGNHDIINFEAYQIPNFSVVDSIKIGQILFTHEPIADENAYSICGHIHPGIRLRGKARQGATLACFYQYKKQLIIPAFGHLTGLFTLEAKASASVYAIVGEEIVLIN
jgi:uncharacterized protein